MPFSHDDADDPATVNGASTRTTGNFHRRYALPLQLASVGAFFKEHIAVIVLGQAASVTQVAYYQVVNRIFVIPRKFILSTMDALLPKIVDAMEADPAHFRKQFRFFAWVQLVFCVAAASAILILQRPIFGLLGIVPTAEVAMVVLFFSINLLFSALSQSNSLGFHFGSDTRAVMVVSILQASILTVLTMLLVPHAQAVGGAIALMVATACSSVMLVIANLCLLFIHPRAPNLISLRTRRHDRFAYRAPVALDL